MSGLISIVFTDMFGTSQRLVGDTFDRMEHENLRSEPPPTRPLPRTPSHAPPEPASMLQLKQRRHGQPTRTPQPKDERAHTIPCQRHPLPYDTQRREKRKNIGKNGAGKNLKHLVGRLSKSQRYTPLRQIRPVPRPQPGVTLG